MAATESNRSRPAARLGAVDWPGELERFNASGFTVIPGVLDSEQCDPLVALYSRDDRFRSRVVMEHHNYGAGDYAYFADPLPALVAELRTLLYPPLARWANAMCEALGEPPGFPAALDTYLAACAEAGQSKPTPLLLHYRAGGFNCLHRDVYGDMVFPLQAMIMLSRPGRDFEGGEFVLVENRPRQQSRAQVVRPSQGDLVLFAGAGRPVPGKRKQLRAVVRHGVSEVLAGERWTLGIIFHNAR